jgi:hypothetical protein
VKELLITHDQAIHTYLQNTTSTYLLTSNAMQQLSDNLIFEKGSDPDVLLIVFTGFANALMMQPFEFMQVSGLYNYSRILVRDPSQRMCLCGIGGELNSLEKLVNALHRMRQDLNARRTIVIGASGGSYSAMLIAHLLKADYSHAFSPFPYANLKRIIGRKDWQIFRHYWKTAIKLNFFPTGTHKYYDLRKVLAEWNGKTRYYAHVCKENRWDYPRALYLDGLPNVELISYPCSQHAVIRYLAKQKKLDIIFNIDNQVQLKTILGHVVTKSGPMD